MRTGIIVAVAGCLLASQLLAQTRKTASISGVVLKEATGEPIADVQVTATPATPGVAPETATTAADGRFEVSNLSPGAYTITAVRTLFVRGRRNNPALTITLSQDEHLRDLAIRLQPTAVISGRVTDASREPVRGVRVEAMRYQYRDGNRTLISAAQTQSDDRGEYRLFNLQPATYLVRATPVSSGPQTMAAVYYPGVVEAPEAAALEAGPGAELAAIDISLRDIPTYSVQLRLVSPIRPPAPAVLRFVALRTDQQPPMAVSSPGAPAGNDVYRISNLLAGAYDIYALSRPGPADPQKINLSGRISINVGKEGTDPATVPLRPAGNLTARIVPSQSLTVTLNPVTLGVILRPMDGLPAEFGTNSRNVAGGVTDDGLFTIPNVVNGRFRVDVTGLPGNAYLIGARYGAADVFDGGVRIDGDPQGPLELFIGGPGSIGTVEGVVRDKDDHPVPQSVVALVPAQNRRQNPAAFKSATTDQRGVFSVRGVLPGDYTVLAWDDLEAGAYQDPDVLRDVEKLGSRITVDAGGRNTVDVSVIKTP